MRCKCRYGISRNKKNKTGIELKPSTLTHTCCFFSFRPLSTKLGGRIQRLAGGQYLEIQEVRPEDSGQYSCVVTNMAGSTSLFFTVEILCKSLSQFNNTMKQLMVEPEPIDEPFYSSSTTCNKGEQRSGDGTRRP